MNETIEYQYRPSIQTGGGPTTPDWVCTITAPNGAQAIASGSSKAESVFICRQLLNLRQEYLALTDIEKLKNCIHPKLEHTNLYEAVALMAKMLIQLIEKNEPNDKVSCWGRQQ